jgi:hypothetical protein
LSQFWNNIYHQENEGTIACYKLKALERDMDKLWAHHTQLLAKLHDFQKQHFDRRQRIADLRYKSNKCWATLAKLYLDDAETNRSGIPSDGTKARNAGQHSLTYTWMMQKPAALESPAISSGISDGEHEWDNRATTQLL